LTILALALVGHRIAGVLRDIVDELKRLNDDR